VWHGEPPKAAALLANPDIGVTRIAHRLGVSPATLYRYIPAARTANTPAFEGARRAMTSWSNARLNSLAKNR